MHRFEDTITIVGRSPEEVFDFLADPSNGPEWISAVSEAHAEGPPEVGRVLHARAGMLGLSFDVRSEVTAYERPVRYGWAGDAPFHTAFDFTLAPVDEGTQVHGTVEVDPGRFFPVGGKLISRRLRKQFDQDVATLKRTLDARG